MPHLGGFELGAALQDLSPDLAILYTSGYLEGSSTSDIVPTIGPFLQKPYSVAELRAKVAELVP